MCYNCSANQCTSEWFLLISRLIILYELKLYCSIADHIIARFLFVTVILNCSMVTVYKWCWPHTESIFSDRIAVRHIPIWHISQDASRQVQLLHYTLYCLLPIFTKHDKLIWQSEVIECWCLCGSVCLSVCLCIRSPIFVLSRHITGIGQRSRSRSPNCAKHIIVHNLGMKHRQIGAKIFLKPRRTRRIFDILDTTERFLTSWLNCWRHIILCYVTTYFVTSWRCFDVMTYLSHFLTYILTS